MSKIKMKRKFLSVLTMLCALVLGTVSIYSQSNKGSIIGTITDPNGAVVPNVKVIVSNNATKETNQVTTNAGGEFAVTNLEPGIYSVRAEASGFKNILLSTVTVETAARVPLEIKFTEVSGVGDNTVVITSDSAPVVESETSVRGDVITGREVTDLPISQRNFTLLAGLSPGVTRPSSTSVGVIGGGGNFVSNGPGSSTESTRFRESGGSVISANGARVTQNNFSLDGVDNNESQFGQIAVYPNPDAIAEFKIETSVPPAESGRAAGAIISTTFKSGGNEIHGTIFENYQGRFLSAASGQFDINNAPPNAQGIRRTPPNFVTHNYGGTIGGPIFLPAPGINGRDKFWYDGRNRTFFFVSVTGQRNGTPAFGGGEFQFVTVPTARMRSGDFSEQLRVLPNAGGCANPANNPGANCQTFNLAGGGSILAPIGTIFSPQGVPIPGNNLANCLTCGSFSTFGQNLIRAYPLPTETGITNNFRRNRAEKYNQSGYDVKIDHKFTDNNSFFGRYSRYKDSRIRDNNFPPGTSPNGNDLPSGFGAGDEFSNSRGITLGDTHVFSPTVVNDMRAGWTNVQIGINNPGINGALGFNPNVSSALGASNINNCGTCEGIILLGIVDPSFSQEFVGDGGAFFFESHNYNFANAVTVIRGNSIFKFGTDLRNRRNSNFDGGRNGGTKGQYQYGTSAGGFAAGNYNGIGPNDTGSAVANFLLGYQPGFVGRGTPGGPYTIQNAELAFFAQNDWKVNSDLTLNLGLRYDVFTAPTERFDRQANFNPATRSVVVAGKNAPGGRDLSKNDLNNFGPRIGFAYSGLKDDKSMVIRGGYGIVYTTDVSGVQPLTTNLGTGAANFSCTPITNPGGCPTGYPVGRNPFERGIPFAPGSEISSAPGTVIPVPNGTNVIYNDPNRKDAYVHQFNLTYQYEFVKNWLAEVAYVGSRSRNLLVVQNIGQTGAPFGNGPNLGGPGTREVAFNGAITTTRYFGKADYNALQTKVEKRLTDGFSLLAAYTFSKTIDNSPGGFCFGGQGPVTCGFDDPLRPELDRGLSDLNVPHRLTMASVYDLPVGKGRKFLSGIPTALDFLIGGWQFNNVITLQSGPVFTPNFRGARPNIIGDPTPTESQRARGIRFNRAAFAPPTQFVFAADANNNACYNLNNGVRTGPNYNCPMVGTLGRNTLRGDNQEYWDASLFKNFPIRAISEAFNVQVRISAFNVWNHVNRSTPNGDIENSEFGIDKSEQRRRQMEFSLKIIF